jgi:hypothetical protein
MGKAEDRGTHVYAVSELATSFAAGETQVHHITFELLRLHEHELRVTCHCPAGVMTYEGEGSWEITDVLLGGFGRPTTASFRREVTVDQAVSSAKHAAEQSISISTEVKPGRGDWQPDAALHHPFTLSFG